MIGDVADGLTAARLTAVEQCAVCIERPNAARQRSRKERVPEMALGQNTYLELVSRCRGSVVTSNRFICVAYADTNMPAIFEQRLDTTVEIIVLA